ncbi:MAG: cob(I)yrinic acid a,c-diamide adenosyltransferase [Acidobacteriota bacterium]|nr:cob(I)yrinic acid a,c-diamide adenosyltransferase [Acidobacteriota bacterium]
MASRFKGYIQVYTGDGKGKTTAALGLALRAAGRGLRVYIGQFLKARESGEHLAAEKLAPLVTIERFGRKGFLDLAKPPGAADIRRADLGMQKCLEAMDSGGYQVVILDEINTAVKLGIVKETDVLAFLENKPESVEVILTGRSAAPSIIRRADLVTEMKEIKHYFRRGVKARRGIET